MKPTLVILAAGAGRRYGGLKPLAAVGPRGETLVEYAAYDALRHGFGRVVLVVRPETEAAFRAALGPGMQRQVPLSFAHQTIDDLPAGYRRDPGRVRPWGTGQAVLAAESEVDGPFAAVNADDFYGDESFAAMSAFLHGLDGDGDEPLESALVGFPVAKTLSAAGPVSRALCELDANGRLAEIVELEEVWRRNDGRILYRDAEGGEQTLGGDEVVSMNMWGFSRSIFSELRRRFARFLENSGKTADREFLLPDVVRALVRESRASVRVLRGSNRWCGITFREDQGRAAAVIADLVDQGRYPRELWI